MHEYSIVQSLIGRVEAETSARGATAVHVLRVSLGELSGVDPALLANAYRTFREHTVCRDAELELRSVPARWTCPRCQITIFAGEPLRCRTCGGPARLLQGDELILESIEMEVG